MSDVVTDLNLRNDKLTKELIEIKEKLERNQYCSEEKEKDINETQLELHNTVTQLEKNLSEAKIQLLNKEKQLEETMGERDEAEKRLHMIDEEAAAKSSRISSLKEELKLLTQDNLTLEEQVINDKAEIEREKNELEEKCTFLHFTQEQLHTQVQTLQELAFSLTSEMEALKLQLENTSEELENEKLKLEEVTETYVKENLDTENEFKRLTKESEELHGAVTTLETTNSEITVKNSELECHLKEVKTQFEETLQNEDMLNSNIKLLKGEIEVLTNDKEALSEELQRVEEEKNGVAFDLATTSKEKHKMEETIAGLKTEKDVVLNEIQALLSEKEEIERQFTLNKDELSKVQDQLSSLFDSSEELQKIATQQKDCLKKKEKESQDLKGEIQELEMKNSSLEGSLSSVQSEVANLESENRTLLVSFESVEDSLRTYIHRCEDLNMEIQELTSCKDDLNQTCLILEARMVEAEKIAKEGEEKLNSLLHKTDKKDEEIKKFIVQTKELEAKVMDLQELVGLLEQRNQTEQEIHEERVHHMKEEIDQSNRNKTDLEKRVKQLLLDFDNVTAERSQLVEMNEELSGQVSENLNTIKSLQDREKELNGRIKLACNELEVAKSGMSSELEHHWAAEDEILQMHAEMEQTNVQLQEATNKITNIKSQVGNLKDQNAELQNRYDTLESSNQNYIHEIIGLQDELKVKADENKKLSGCKNQITDLESKLRSIESENSTAKLEIVNKKEEILSLNLSLEELQNIIGDHEKKIEELEGNMRGTDIFIRRFQEMESLLKEYMNDVNELEEKDSLNQKEIKLKNDLISNLRAELDPLQEETETYKEKYEALCNLIEPFKEQLESFKSERSALLERNKEAEGEVKKLATQYGQLLGHQNHKQKIQHLVRLKKENVDMREEMSRMRIELDKYRRMALKHESTFKYQNKENSVFQNTSSVNMSTIGAGRTPAPIRTGSKIFNEECNPKPMIFSSTPFRRQTIASPLSNRNRQHSPRT